MNAWCINVSCYVRFLLAFSFCVKTINCQDGDQLGPGIACPRGFYHDPIYLPALVDTNECKPCARGKYGSKSGLTTPDCTADCPRGRYGNKWAAVSVDDCPLCPPNTFGSTTGLDSPACTDSCPTGKYSLSFGATSAATCSDCPPSYRGSSACVNRDSILLQV